MSLCDSSGLVSLRCVSFLCSNLTLTEGFSDARTDVSSALASGGLSSLQQVIIFSRNATGNSTGLLRVTGKTSAIVLPYSSSNGSPVILGDDDEEMGYPPALYPNITYNSTSTPDPLDPSVNFMRATAFSDFPLNQSSVLLLGPTQVNASFALISVTLPLIDNSNPDVVLGFMTVVAAASSLIDVTTSREGLANSGVVLIVGSSRRDNHFTYSDRPADGAYVPAPGVLKSTKVKFIFPPDNSQSRHNVYTSNLTKYGASNFSMGSYPAALTGFGKRNSQVNLAGSLLTTKNENNVSVSVGFARPNTSLADWLLIVEQSHAEAWAPVTTLRRILYACVFGTMGFVILVVLPIAHFSVRPIRRLRDATEKSITPMGYTPSGGSLRSEGLYDDASDGEADLENRPGSNWSKRGVFVRLRYLTTVGRRKTKLEHSEEERRRGFKIPAKVPDRKHWITDELTELTSE